MKIRHKYLKSTKIIVNKEIAESGVIELDAEGYLIDAGAKAAALLKHPDFTLPESKAEKAELSQPKEPVKETEKPVMEEKPLEPVETPIADEPAEGDVKIENAKAFIYKKNAAGKLLWLRDPQNDPKK